MRFQNVRPEELEGPIKLKGYCDWAKGLNNNGSVTSVLLVSAPGAGKGAAIGALAEHLRYDVLRCRVRELLEYPDPAGEFKALLAGSEHLQHTVIWLDGVDRLIEKLPNGGAAILEEWLKSEREALARNSVIIAATAGDSAKLSEGLKRAFDQTFQA